MTSSVISSLLGMLKHSLLWSRFIHVYEQFVTGSCKGKKEMTFGVARNSIVVNATRGNKGHVASRVRA